jgi:pimeloyl-ACP methyl ester carboxylesterase
VYVTGLTRLPEHRRLLGGLTASRGLRPVFPAWPDPTVGVDPDASVVAVPYDFRQPVAAAVRWLGDVIDAWAPDPDEPVRIVAHSMGGLVATGWFTLGEGWQRHTNVRMVTVGTPFGGATKALDVLTRPALPFRGARRFFGDAIMETLRTWPSVYDLLPLNAMVEHDGTWLRPCDLHPFPGFSDQARRAIEFHDQLDAAWADVPEARLRDVVCILGHGRGTLSSARLTVDGLSCSEAPPAGVAPSEGGGDGTVPRISAHRRNLESPVTRRGVGHLPLWHDVATVGLVDGWFERPGSAIRGIDDGDLPYLDVDLPDAIMAGTEITVTARVSPDAPLAREVGVRLEISEGPTQRLQVMDRTDDEIFTTRLELSHPGDYEVSTVIGETSERSQIVEKWHVAALPEESLV